MKMKLVTIVLGVAFLGTLIGLTMVRSQERSMQQCSNPIDGLLFCTSTSRIVVAHGSDVIIKLSLKNTTDEPVSIPTGRFEDYYPIKVVDSNGDEVKSIKEKALERLKKGEGNDDDWNKTLIMGSRPGPYTLEAGGERPMELNLSQYYDFSRGGAYQVAISRKVKDKTGKDAFLSLDGVKIEIQ